MAVITIVGPLKTAEEARATAKALGANCTAYGVERKDADGYGTGIDDWFVERDDSIPSGKLFGYETNTFMARQYR